MHDLQAPTLVCMISLELRLLCPDWSCALSWCIDFPWQHECCPMGHSEGHELMRTPWPFTLGDDIFTQLTRAAVQVSSSTQYCPQHSQNAISTRSPAKRTPKHYRMWLSAAVPESCPCGFVFP